MGLLDNNIVKTSPKTGLEGTMFKHIISNDNCDVWVWDKNTSGRSLKATYRNIFVWAEKDKLYIVKGNITDEPIIVEVNDTNFPNIRKNESNKYPAIIHAIVCPCTFGYNNTRWGNISNITTNRERVCVIFENGQIYHNYPASNDLFDFYTSVYRTSSFNTLVEDLFTKFDESAIWDLPNRKHPVKTTSGTDATLIATGMYYYNPALPDKCYEFHPAIGEENGYGNTVGFAATTNVNNISNGANIGTRARFWRTDMENLSACSVSYMGGFIADNLFTMIATYQANSSAKPCRMCLFGTQDGGRNWFAMYEFAGRTRIKKGESSYVNAAGYYGVELAQTGSATSDIYSVKRRTIIAPYDGAKEPSVLFEYDTPVLVQSISGSSESITVTTTTNHGFINGDCVVFDFQDDVSANGRDFDWIVNSGANDTTGGNGVMFMIKKTSDTEFTLTQYIWNPDSNLPIRHIHALNRCKDGVTISCGEEYPNGGWFIYDAIRGADAFWGYNVGLLNTKNNNFVRLTSTANSFMRGLGCILQQEDKDTYCYIGVDHEDTPMNDVEMPEGRTETFKHNSVGVWKVSLDGIDNQADNGEIKLNTTETCFGFQKIGNAFVFVGQYGTLAISYDNCNTWCVMVIPVGNWGQDGCHFSGITYDRKFSIDNILIQLKK